METIIPIIRSTEIEVIDKLVQLLIEEEFKTFEITTNFEDVFEYVNDLNNNDSSLSIGVGSVITDDHVEQAIKNNIKFVVTPNLNVNIIKKIVKNKIPVYAGCLTPSEISQALNLNVDVIKIFPANSMPLDYARSIKAPFPNINIIAVGGVNSKNYSTYLENEYNGFGFSSDMMKFANDGKWDELRNLLKEYKRIEL